MPEVIKTKVAVIGAGPGGYSAAFTCADLGLDTLLIDPEKNPGGTCLYRGCIPTKTLLYITHTIQNAKDATNFGVYFSPPKLDINKVRNSTQDVVNYLTEGLGKLSQLRGVKYIQGRASFLDSNTLEVFLNDGRELRVITEYSIVAVGSRPALFGAPIDSPDIINSNKAVFLEEIPEKMLVIGGGYIGLELGSVYALLGAEVTLVEVTPGILPGIDRDLVKPLEDKISKIFSNIHTNTEVKQLKPRKKGILVEMEGPNIKKKTQIFDKVLVCVGRKPNSSGLGLKNTKVESDDKGFIKVNEQRRTADPMIFAIGDVAGGPMLAHKATHEGRISAEVIAGRNVAFEPQAIPAVVFTDPEIAWCGITEELAKVQKIPYEVAKFPWQASGRAKTLFRNEGLTKMIIHKETKQILGIGIVGTNAGELISEATLAIEMGATPEDLDLTIHPHPTLSETIMECAGVYLRKSIHYYRKNN
ncbi:MAG: dihydrolipoyl dehydrogenase [Candidatus Hydrogenedentes bacterium]|nr:dihydrolipoyl dehydrogenase [Candidatus Hydrogenedentota bacterium]